MSAGKWQRVHTFSGTKSPPFSWINCSKARFSGITTGIQQVKIQQVEWITILQCIFSRWRHVAAGIPSTFWQGVVRPGRQHGRHTWAPGRDTWDTAHGIPTLGKRPRKQMLNIMGKPKTAQWILNMSGSAALEDELIELRL